jgi:hypothetical protein
MFGWVRRWWYALLGRLRRPVHREEAVRLAVRALQSLEDYPVLLSPDELPAHVGRPVYLLTRAEFSSAAEQMRVLESGRDLWAIDFRFVDPAETGVAYSHPEGPSFTVDARTRRVKLWCQM